MKFEDALSRLPVRPVDADKGAFGRLLVVGGCAVYPHAPVLAALGALRAGVGLVALDVPPESRMAAACWTPEAFFHSPDVPLAHYSAVVFGPGLGMSSETVLHAPKILVDADGLNRLAKAEERLPREDERRILTPHPGEAARLLGVSVSDVQADRLGAARELAARYGSVVALKGAESVVCDVEGEFYVNKTGNPGMATAGAGDVLAGVIGALWAQGMPAFEAASAGVYFHGAAGDRLARRIGMAAVTATGIAEELCICS